MLFRELIGIACEKHTKSLSVRCWQNVTLRGTYILNANFYRSNAYDVSQEPTVS